MVKTFFVLALGLFSRSSSYQQPEDVKSSVKYFRFLRINSHLFGGFDSHGMITSSLVQSLAKNLVLGSGDTIQDIEDMVALIPDLIVLDISTNELREVMKAFTEAVDKTGVFRRKGTEKLAEGVIQMLRAATGLKLDSQWHNVYFALASCLSVRFQATHVINDFEEAIAIADKIIAAHSPRDGLMQTNTITLIQVLLASRLNSYSKPEYIEDTIHRTRTLLSLPSLPDEVRTLLTNALNAYVRRRFSYFGVTGSSGETLTNPLDAFNPRFVVSYEVPRQCGAGPEDDHTSQILEKVHHLEDILVTIVNDEITGIEAAVELSRSLHPLQEANSQWSFLPSLVFANILFHAHRRTGKLEYLNDTITVCRDIRKVTAVKAVHFHVGMRLLHTLVARSKLFYLRQDFDEFMQLFHGLANDGSGEIFTRFQISYAWARTARVIAHDSISTAYETTMSLLQETLVHSPTLQTQHFCLAHTFTEGLAFASDYASYQIEKGQFKQAIETLERGRALLWSEMRGLRTSTDQLRSAHPALADKFADINWRLESVTMSPTRGESEAIGDSETEDRRRKHSIGHLVPTQRGLLEERETLISHIQSLPGFDNFLKPPSFDILNSVAVHGPVIIINQSQFPSYIIILLRDSPPSVISTPSNFHDRANQLKKDLLRVRKEKGLDSEGYDVALTFVLADLYELVGKPVIGRLHQLEIPEKSRIWWCPTEAFCSLPLHAMGPIPSDDGNELYFSDLYIPSYTPTLTALIESRKPNSQPKAFDKPSLLLVAQPETLFGAWGEIEVIQTTKIPVTTLISAMATPETVVEGLRGHRFAHFVCHGLLETGKPFDTSLELHGDNLTLLDIIRSRLPAAEFAFLSACHTAELTEDSVADEGLHLAAAMQYCGFRSVVGTMWAMADTDGADLSKRFYKSIFSDKAGQNEVPYYERSARALQIAVNKLRRKRGITLERWVNFVHYGA